MTTLPQLSSRTHDPVLDWVVLKITQLCNLNCSYCYVYNRGDESWRSRPRFITQDIVEALARRVAEHCDAGDIRSFVVEIHGGEPLLLGRTRMRDLVASMRSICSAIDLRFVLQTNATLLDHDWLEFFAKHDIRFSFSLDGPPESSDLFRMDRRGVGSTNRILTVIEKLRQQSDLFEQLNSGALCVINPKMDGGALVRWFAAQEITAFDFLLPDGNSSNLPHGWDGPAEYGRFLIEAFDEWYSMGEAAPRIRKFELMIRGFMGVPTTLDSLGGDLRGLCVVESDGSIGVSDVMRICGGEFSKDTMNILTHPLSAHGKHYNLAKLQEPATQCVRCEFFSNCGGGYLPHRYDGTSFANPSLYCAALFDLASHIGAKLKRDVPAELWTVV